MMADDDLYGRPAVPSTGGFAVEAGLVVEVARTEALGVKGVAAVSYAGVADQVTMRRRWWVRLWDRLTGTPHEIAGGRVTVTVTVVAEYGPSLPELADELRERLAATLSGLTGLGAAAVDVVFSDLHIPGEPLPLPLPETSAGVAAASVSGPGRLDF
jgi:uncharacterized alkaline shock family protein YloU